MEQRHKNNLSVFILIILALVAILFSVGNSKLNLTFLAEQQRVENIDSILYNIPVLAKAVSVYDVTLDKKIYGENDTIPLPLASLVKTMTAIVALNDHKPDDIVTISPEAVKQAGDYGLFPNENWKIEDLIKFTLVGSVNDGAFALAQSEPDFLAEMNAKAQKLGMINTLFSNFTGLDIDNGGKELPNTPGAVASAEDANTMAVYAFRYRPDIFSATTLSEINFKSLSDFEHNMKNTDVALDKIPNLLFSKTGYTDLAQGNLSIIFKNAKGHDIAVTVMGSTFDGRFTDMENVVNVLYNL